MAEVITTLHPENDDTIDLYPNIKKENIPAGAIETNKIANEAVTENKLDPALQARLADEVVIVELSGTSGVISESSFNKLVNAEMGIIKLDNEYYYKAYIKEMGSPSYPVYHFVILNQYAINDSNKDYLIRKDIAVNSSTRYWVKYTDSKYLGFYDEATETILIDHVDTGDLHSDGAISTDAGITAETESNIAGVVMDDGNLYADEIYLGDGEQQLSGELQFLEDYDDDNFYHLGEYDSVASETPLYVLINRKTGYCKLEDVTFTNFGQTLMSSEDLKNYIELPSSDNVKGEAISINYTTVARNSLDNLNELAINSTGTIYVRNNQTTYPSGVLQYKLNSNYQYQEKVFKKRPLSSLTKDGSNWLYNEWLKTLNLATKTTIVNNVSNNYDAFITITGLNLIANHFYTISFYSVNTLSGARYYVTGDNNHIDYSYTGANSSKNYYSITVKPNGSESTIRVRLQYNSDNTKNTGTTTNVMLNESEHPEAFQKYNGRLVHAVDIEPVTLWTNPTPNVDFGGQITVSDMSIYKYIVIEYKDDPSSDTASKYLKCKYEALKSLYIEHPDGMRLVDFLNSTTIDFDYTASYIIPVAIYGTNIL